MERKLNMWKYDKARIISKFIKMAQEMRYYEVISSVEAIKYQKQMIIDESYYNN